MKLNKNGGCESICTAEGVEIEGVLCHSVELTQAPHEKNLGLVLVKMEMMVYESDLSTTGKFKATDFIKRAGAKRVR